MRLIVRAASSMEAHRSQGLLLRPRLAIVCYIEWLLGPYVANQLNSHATEAAPTIHGSITLF